MTEPKFKIGQMVLFRPRSSRGINIALNHPYQVIRRLTGDVPQYRIRCTQTGDEFTASESELRLSSAQ